MRNNSIWTSAWFPVVRDVLGRACVPKVPYPTPTRRMKVVRSDRRIKWIQASGGRRAVATVRLVALMNFLPKRMVSPHSPEDE